jgi:hypothetical protein
MNEREEAKKAHAKLRLEVRQAVTEKLLHEVTTRDDLRAAVEKSIVREVDRAMKGERVAKALNDVLRKEISKAFGDVAGNSLRIVIREAVSREAEKLAKEYVWAHITLGIREGGDW